jgi:hypothetical protein
LALLPVPALDAAVLSLPAPLLFTTVPLPFGVADPLVPVVEEVALLGVGKGALRPLVVAGVTSCVMPLRGELPMLELTSFCANALVPVIAMTTEAAM